MSLTLWIQSRFNFCSFYLIWTTGLNSLPQLHTSQYRNTTSYNAYILNTFCRLWSIACCLVVSTHITFIIIHVVISASLVYRTLSSGLKVIIENYASRQSITIVLLCVQTIQIAISFFLWISLNLFWKIMVCPWQR